MSIETLLEAAKFLELQAQQQQKTRGKKKCTYGIVWRVCAKGTLNARNAAAVTSHIAYDGSCYDLSDCQNNKGHQLI